MSNGRTVFLALSIALTVVNGIILINSVISESYNTYLVFTFCATSPMFIVIGFFAIAAATGMGIIRVQSLLVQSNVGRFRTFRLVAVIMLVTMVVFFGSDFVSIFNESHSDARVIPIAIIELCSFGAAIILVLLASNIIKSKIVTPANVKMQEDQRLKERLEAAKQQNDDAGRG